MKLGWLWPSLGAAVVWASSAGAQPESSSIPENCVAKELTHWEVHKDGAAPTVDLEWASLEGFRLKYNATAPHETNPGRRVAFSARFEAPPGRYRLALRVNAAEDYGNAQQHPEYRRFLLASISSQAVGDFSASSIPVAKHKGPLNIQQDVEISSSPVYISFTTFSVRTGAVEGSRLTLCPVEYSSNPVVIATVSTQGAADQKSGRSSEPLLPNQRIWFEQAVVRATTGYDARNDRTLISSYSLVVVGPESLEKALIGIAQQCAEESGLASIAAFQQTPSPEVGVRIGAAWAAFKVAIQSCLSMKQATKSLESKFELSYVRRAHWEKGLALHFDADNPTAVQYRNLHELVRKHLPEPMNKAVQFFISTQDIPRVNLKIRTPDAVKPFLYNLPDTEALQSYASKASDLARKNGQKLVDQAVDEGKRRANQAGQESARLQLVQVQLAGDTAKMFLEEVRKLGPRLEAISADMAKAASNFAEDVANDVKEKPEKYLFPVPGVTIR